MKILSHKEFSVFSKLRELRKKLAAKDSVLPFVVFTDEQLALIVRQKPENLEKLTAIQGIGQSKTEKYGSAVLKILKEQNESGRESV